MTNQNYISALLDLVRARQSFLITSHARPDGDAIGTSLGLMHLLEAMGKQTTVVFTDTIPMVYRCLPGVERIVKTLPAVTPQAAIFLECSSVERSSLDEKAFDAAKPALTINIDHHQSGREFAGFNWIDPQECAVGAMVYELAIASGTPITAAMATCLYAAIMTDTGSFMYPSTTASTFGMAQHLVECGADAPAIAQAIYANNPPGRVRLLGVALQNLQFDQASGDSVAWTTITTAERETARADVEDSEGIISYLIGIAGVEAAAIIRETPTPHEYRLSLRSKGKLDVARVAETFSGGGHRNASGCTIHGSLVEVTEKIVGELRTAALELRSAAATAPSTLIA
jgi:phosphoesterase RecJ-like protein